MIDQLGGWSLQSVGQGYGDGYSINTLYEMLCNGLLCHINMIFNI